MNQKQLLIFSVVFCWLAGFASALLFVSGYVDDINMTKEFLEKLSLKMIGLGVVFGLIMRFLPKKRF